MKWFKKINIKIKFALFIIGSILTAILFFYLKTNLKFKKQMEYELAKVKKETELTYLKEDSKEKEEELKLLQEEEKLILEKIKYIEGKEVKGEEVSVEELEDFFAKRGF